MLKSTKNFFSFRSKKGGRILQCMLVWPFVGGSQRSIQPPPEKIPLCEDPKHNQNRADLVGPDLIWHHLTCIERPELENLSAVLHGTLRAEESGGSRQLHRGRVNENRMVPHPHENSMSTRKAWWLEQSFLNSVKRQMDLASSRGDQLCDQSRKESRTKPQKGKHPVKRRFTANRSVLSSIRP